MISLPNTQPIEKVDYREDGSLDVHSVFMTIQGEGPFAGTPSVFVRLAGCDLQCPECDTDYTSSRRRSSLQDVMSLVEHHKQPKTKLIVLTGGEPFRQNIKPFVELAYSRKYDVQIETNGTLYVAGVYLGRGVSIVCSPKTPHIHKDIDNLASAFKYVLDADHVDPNDGLPTSVLGMSQPPARPRHKDTPVYVQPADSQDPAKNKRNMDAAVQSCLKQNYRLSCQIHKVFGLE